MLTFHNAQYPLSKYLTVTIPELHLQEHSLVVLLGQNGSGKSAIARALSGELDLGSGEAPQGIHAELVSFEKQQALFAADYELRNSDALMPGEELGILVKQLFESSELKLLNEAMAAFGVIPLLERPIRTLSGGEGRKVLLVKALSTHPDLLVLDTPFDALDQGSRRSLLEVISYIHQNYKVPIVLIVNRPDEIPDECETLGLISHLSITKLGPRTEITNDPETQALLFCAALPNIELPPTPRQFALLSLKDDTIVDLKDINITYNRPIFTHLNFQVRKGEHWQILGPNGAGKSTLLSLITGDNPLVYTNDVTVFGMKRGSGESIWDVKRYFGIVSGQLHLDYRVSAPVINVMLSGLYDSIGLYQQPKGDELRIARQWLALIGLADLEATSFKALSFGQQRLLLIARAMIKNPPLLILDEPLQGLDASARALVKAFLSYIMKNGHTSVLFVSHHNEDAPDGITNRLTFVPKGIGYEGYEIVQERLNADAE